MKRSTITLALMIASASPSTIASPYLLLNFQNEYKGLLPKYIALYSNHQNAPMHLRRKRAEHFDVDGKLNLIRIPTGSYQLLHLDFGGTHRKSNHSLRFAQPLKQTYEPGNVYYFGDIFFEEDSFYLKPVPATFTLVCREHGELLASKQLVVILTQKGERKALRIKDPCRPTEKTDKNGT